MTVSDIIQEVRQIVQQTNAANSSVSDSILLSWINACTLELCARITTLPKVSVPGITAASTITLSQNLLRLDFASISDGATPPVYRPLETIDFVNFARINPDWQNQIVSQPRQLVRMTDLTWMMFPPPDAIWTGKSVSIYGSVLPTALTLTSESPALPIVTHQVYPHYCAWKFFLAINNPERANSEYATYDTLRKIVTSTATSTTGSLLSLKIRGM